MPTVIEKVTATQREIISDRDEAISILTGQVWPWRLRMVDHEEKVVFESVVRDEDHLREVDRRLAKPVARALRAAKLAAKGCEDGGGERRSYPGILLNSLTSDTNASTYIAAPSRNGAPGSSYGAAGDVK